MAKARNIALGLSLFGVVIAACECDGIENAAPNGYIDPALYDFGPIPLDTQCQATLRVVNNGTADLSIEQVSLKDTDGNFQVVTFPQFVGFGASGDILVRYVSEGPENERQSTTVEVKTNIATNDGVLQASVTALPTNEEAAVARSACDVEGTETSPCPALEFGATQKSDPAVPIAERTGKTLTIDILNEGNAAMEVAAAVIDGGDGDFTVTGLRLGNVLVETPVTVAPGRAGECGEPVEGSCNTAATCNRLTVDVFYSPTALGADTAELVVLSDAAEGAEIRIPLSGFGSDIGILTNPEFVSFGDVGEGQTADIDVRVANVGTSDAPVNNTCIDLQGDGTCDGNCTGAEPVLDGALSCEVLKSDGSHEGKGFVLAPTDAAEGGDDERTVRVSWAPVAGNTNIPAGTTLRLETGILSDKVYTVPVAGGAAGVLEVETDAVCGEELCVPAAGDPGDISTWTGEIALTLVNTGDATLDVTAFEWDGPATIADDYALLDGSDNPVDLASPGISLAPGASVPLTITYANDDASVQDFINLVVSHTGLGGLVTLPLRVVAPE